MPKRINVYISSASIDLPEHRQAVISALAGIGLFPMGMEQWPENNEYPVELCLQSMTKANIYVGIYAHRYGWRPDGPETKSIVELEYDWATECGIPCYCFIMHEDHPWPLSSMELDAKNDLDAFKDRVRPQIAGFFTDPHDLKTQVLHVLADYAQKKDLSATEPYMKQLHRKAQQSGLLRILDARTRDLTSQGRPVTVDQIYTPLDTRTQVFRDDDGAISWTPPDPKETFDRETTPLSAMEAARQFPHLVVLGDPGSGKSTFVGFLALALTGHRLYPNERWMERLHDQGWKSTPLLEQEGWGQDDVLPVHITLRDFAQDMGPEDQHGTAQSLIDHIARLMEECGCPEAMDAVWQAMTDGQVLLILDGLDEVPAGKRAAVRNAVESFMFAYDRCRMLITCRILSYANPAWHIPNTATVTLAPFDREQIERFIEAWYTAAENLGSITAEDADARIKDLRQASADVKLCDMATNPMLLTVMAIVHNHRGTLPRETARLYDQCVEILMLRWRPEEARHLKDELELPDETDLYRILWQIAYEAHENQADRVGAADIAERDVIAIAAKEHLKGDWRRAQIFCNYVEERAGLLIGRGDDASQHRVYAFPHRTFQEYLAGCHIADDADFAGMIDAKARAGADWRQVVLLAAGHMYFNKNDRHQPLYAARYILYGEPKETHDWLAVSVVGEILALIGLPALEKHKMGPELITLARKQLVALIQSTLLEPVERAAAGRALSQLGDPRPGVDVAPQGAPSGVGIPDIDWVEIPEGEFIFGDESEGNGPQPVTLPTFHISRYPVTYAQFQAFVDAEDGFYNPVWWEDLEIDDEERHAPAMQVFQFSNHPRDSVSWFDAVVFCRWLSSRLGFEVRLPTEMEWEKAARGTDGRAYPWGNEYISGYANVNEGNEGHYLGQTTAVGLYPQGASPYSVLDMIGNIAEWCLDVSPDLHTFGNARIMRGADWSYPHARVTSPIIGNSLVRHLGFGFRIVCSDMES